MGETQKTLEKGTVVLKLATPVRLGQEGEEITELKLRWSARACKDFQLLMMPDGTTVYEPYPLAQFGMRLANHPPSLIEELCAEDFNALARAALGFLA